MMEQYRSIKAKYPDTILFFRLGDFYEMFFEDAVTASALLQITLTARNKGEHKAPMCGIPHHAADAYISKLTKLGRKVAICEQLSDPNMPGIVERDVIRVITPGTTFDENILEQKSNNYLAAVNVSSSGYGLSYADITTGEFRKTDVESPEKLNAEVERINPAEVIIPENIYGDAAFEKFRAAHTAIFFYPYRGAESDPEAMLLDYIQGTQKLLPAHLREIQPYESSDYMPLDEASLKNLELVTTLRENKKEGSLLWVLDATVTAMGGRMLRSFLTHPLVNREEIELRSAAVEELFRDQNLLADLRETLKPVMDLERLTARLSLNQGNARDLIGLKNSLKVVPLIKNRLGGISSALLASVRDRLDEIAELTDLIEKAIIADPPITSANGGIIADGYDVNLDELRRIMREGKAFIQNLQMEEIRRTGINTLKVRYNKIFGYYIEVSKGNAKNVPEDYIRRQTLVNAERFITPALKEFEEKVLSAEEKIIAIEQRIFLEVRENVVRVAARIQNTAGNLALLDVIGAFAEKALQNNYCRPEILEDGITEIIGGRHPVVEKVAQSGSFVPNDVTVSCDDERLLLITGPNMGGKSTYLRQVALITLLAQIGSFVPATKARIGLTDRIFTRVGASDNLVRGQSTFMVEMQETANILANATSRSLVILDEIGRGTSTYDGMSIAWAVMEYLHDAVKCRTLFATHYHELISLAEKLPHSANFSAAVKEDGKDGVVFLYQVLRGGVDRSYGIEVAKLAGLPGEVIGRAQKILSDLEEGVMESGIKKEIESTRRHDDDRQTQIFGEKLPERKHAAIKELENLDVNSLTPMQALQKLDQFKKQITEKDADN
jgi:DNA mismatch repair protein MutS